MQWSAIHSEENAAVFADFLQNLHQGKNIRNKELKGRVTEWLAYLAAEENRELRKQLFLVAQEAATSCVDRAAFYFNQMYILMIEDRLIKKARQRKRYLIPMWVYFACSCWSTMRRSSDVLRLRVLQRTLKFI